MIGDNTYSLQVSIVIEAAAPCRSAEERHAIQRKQHSGRLDGRGASLPGLQESFSKPDGMFHGTWDYGCSTLPAQICIEEANNNPTCQPIRTTRTRRDGTLLPSPHGQAFGMQESRVAKAVPLDGGMKRKGLDY